MMQDKLNKFIVFLAIFVIVSSVFLWTDIGITRTTYSHIINTAEKECHCPDKSPPNPERLSNNHTPKTNITIILGIGTGRSGTLAFSKLLNQQAHTKITHENGRCNNLEWSDAGNFNLAAELANKRIEKIINSNMNSFQKNLFIGDIALWYLPYVEKMLSIVDNYSTKENTSLHYNIKIIALKRDKADCINSFISWFSQWDHFPWIENHLRPLTKFKNHNFDNCYPRYDWTQGKPPSKETFDYLTIKMGAEKYYDDYYNQVDKLIEKYPSQIKLVDSYAILNNDREKEKLFNCRAGS